MFRHFSIRPFIATLFVLAGASAAHAAQKLDHAAETGAHEKPALSQGVRLAQISIGGGGGGFQIGIGGLPGPRRTGPRNGRNTGTTRPPQRPRTQRIRPRLGIDIPRPRDTRPDRRRTEQDRRRARRDRDCRRVRRNGEWRYRCRPRRPVIVVTPPPTRYEEEVTPPHRNTATPSRRPPPPPVPPRRAATPLPPAAVPPIPVPRPVLTAEENFWPDEVVVQLAGTSPAQTEALLAQAFNLTLLGSEANALIGRRIVHYRIGDGRSVAAVVTALTSDPRVEQAQPNWRYRVGETTPAGQGQAPAALQYAAAKLRLADAHQIARGAGIRIAVIDSGIDDRHPALAGQITTRFDAAPGRGDRIGAHGTAIGGILKASGLLTGVAPSAELMGVRAFFASRAGGPEESSTIVVLRALDWAVGNGARIVNMSFAGPRDGAVEMAVAAAHGRGAILVAAAGNGGPDAAPAYPAAYDDVIAVTATDPQDRLYAKANRGTYIDVAAPGVDIFVVAPEGAYRHSSGTSLAAAHVSGLVALLLERARGLEGDDVVGALVQGATDLGAPGVDEEFGAGRIDGAGLLQSTGFEIAKPANR